jgi:protein-tyrosine-phosphatase
MTQKTYNVLFLCSENSARSLMAEAIMQREGLGKFKSYSAGSQPSGTPNPNAMALLERNNFDTGLFRSKSWDEFAAADAPKMDFVITLCDQAAGEECPVWPGQPMLAHWGLHDPAKFEGNEAHTGVIFAKTYGQLRNRITIFANLPIDSLDKLSLQRELDDIGNFPKDE